MPAADPRLVALDADGDAVVHGDRQRLGATHAAEAGGHRDGPGEGAPEALVRDGGEGLERALQDALGADVDPGPGGHLAVHGETEVLEPSELLPVGPVADQVGVRDENSRRPLVGAQHPDRLTALHEQRLVGLQRLQGADDRVVGLPVPGGLAGAAVDDELLGVLGDLGVEVVHQHAHGRLGLPGLGGERRCRAARGSRVLRGVVLGHASSPIVDSTASTTAPEEMRPTTSSISGARWRSGPGPGTVRRSEPSTAAGGGRRRERGPQVEGAGRGEDLDGQHPGQSVDGAAQLARCRPAHRHVVLLHRRRRDRVDGGRHGQALELRDDARLGVLGDHVAGVDPGVVGEEGRQSAVADVSRKRSVLRSLIEARSATAIARKSST